MPVLPIIDLLILLGWTTMAAGGVLKAIHMSTSYKPSFAGLTPADLMLVALCFLFLALTLAARTWVRHNEPELLARRRAAMSNDPILMQRFQRTPADGVAPVEGRAAGNGREDAPYEGESERVARPVR